MKFIHSFSSKKLVSYLLLAALTIALLFSCRKSDKDVDLRPVISYQQKIISVPVDQPMIPVRPDSTGGSISEFTIKPSLPKGISINKLNGVISGTASDTLTPTKFIVTASGPGGADSDTLTISVGTISFNYGTTGTITLEKNSSELNATPVSPVILAGTFTQFFVSPSPDSLTLKTGLKFNSQNGQISGTPTLLTSTTEVSKPVTFTITGISTGNKAFSTTVSFIINDKKPAFTYTFGGSYTVGTAVGNTLAPTKFSTSGNIIKYRLAPGSPALPAGLILDSLSGNITGIPTAAGNATIVIRGLNTGGYQDVNIPLVITATATAPEVRYMMSFFSGNVIDTIAPRFLSGNIIYLTKPDSYGGLNIFLNPILTNGQAASNAYTVSPGFVSGSANENLNISASTGVVSGTPGQFTTNSTPTHTINIANASSGGPTGAFTMNVVANAPFFTYNADNGNGSFLQNVFGFAQGQDVSVANGTYPGYTAAGLKPVGGADVVSYAIYPVSSAAPAFSATGLNFNTTTGAISGTPTTNTYTLNYSFWDYAIVGKKADGSFTTYKIRIKIYRTTSEWGS